MLYNIISFIVGFVLGLFIYAQLVLPLLYGLPRAIWHVARGELQFRAIPAQFIAPLIWFCLLFIVGFLMGFFAPSLIQHTLGNAALNYGMQAGLVLLLLNFFSKSGRQDMNIDFMKSTFARYTKNT
jgi:hypothetical protein